MANLKKGKSIITFFDFFSVLLFLILIIWSSIDNSTIPIFTFVFAIYFGFAILYSNKFKDISYIEKMLYWISQNVIRPRTNYNYILFGLFMIMMGIGSLFILVNGNLENDELLWDSLRKDVIFWISITLILIFNFLIGLYTYTYKKRKLKKRKDMGSHLDSGHDDRE